MTQCQYESGWSTWCGNDRFTNNTKGGTQWGPGGHCYQKKAVSDLSECNPSASGRGDPHMTNIHGEKFNIIRQGYAPLVSIASEGTPHLEVMALIQGAKKCQKKMFITHVNSSGSWLEKTVAVSVGAQIDSKAFSVTVDGQEVWSPASKGYQPPADDNLVFQHADKFSINEISRNIAQDVQSYTWRIAG